MKEQNEDRGKGPSASFMKAMKRVERIKQFYRHLTGYIVVNIILLILKFKALDYFVALGIEDPGFFEWFKVNLYITPLLWGIGLAVHGLIVFKFNGIANLRSNFLADWEEREIKKMMDKEDSL